MFAEAVSVLSVLPYALPVSQSGTGVRPVFKVCVNKFITQDGYVKGAEGHLSYDEHQENCLKYGELREGEGGMELTKTELCIVRSAGLPAV